MRIAVISEISTSARNKDVVQALDGLGHTVWNAGMQDPESTPSLTYIHTGLMSALLLWTQAADLVVGGCGTGQGYLNSVMQYPGVVCGLVVEPLDAFLLAQINVANCISLPLNKGYGWAGNVNLRYAFEAYFRAPSGGGYPAHRSESQRQSRKTLSGISGIAHKDMRDILRLIEPETLNTVLQCQLFHEMVQQESRHLENRDYLLSLYNV